MGWLSGWPYRKVVTLVEQSGGIYNDYPTITTVAYNAHMKNDFTDCRFTESDGTTLVPYGIVEKTDGVSCSFVIKRNYTSGCTLTVYLYYGNPDTADTSVDHGPWASAWYIANGFGLSPSAFTDTNCAAYPHSASEAIPTWADVIFGGCTANGGYRTYYGRVKINGVAASWASTVVCNGDTVSYQLKWKKYFCSTSMYDHGSFVAGASNTVTWGHYSGANTGFWVSYYPTDPSVSFGGEEEETLTADLSAQFEVGQDSAELLGRTVIRHEDSAEAYGHLIIRNVGSAEVLGKVNITHSVELPGKGEVRHSGFAELLAWLEVGQDAAELLSQVVIRHVGAPVELLCKAKVRHVGTPVELLGKADIRQLESADVYAHLIVRNIGSAEAYVRAIIRNVGSAEVYAYLDVKYAGSAEVVARLEVGQDSAELLGEASIRHVGTPVELPGKFDAQAIKDLFGEITIRHPAYPLWLRGDFSVGMTNRYLDLLGYWRVRRSTQRDLAARSIVIHSSTQELSTSFIASHSDSSDLLGKTIIGHISSRDLSCNFVTQDFADLSARMIIGPAKASDIYIAPLDPSGWVNEVVGIGQGFIAMPWVEADSVITKGSYSSVRLTSTYGSGQYKEIRFGWCGMGWGFEVEGLTPVPIDTDGRGPRRGSRGQGDQRREVPQEGVLKDLAASFEVVPEGFKDLAADFYLMDWRSRFWNQTPDGLSDGIIEWDDVDGTIVAKAYEWGYDTLGVSAGTFKQYDSGTFEWEAKYTNPVPFTLGGAFTELILGCLTKVDFMVSYYIPGTIFVGWDSDTGSPIFRTGAGYVPEGMTSTDLTGVVDFTQKHKYKIIWENASQYPATGRARLYIDDVLRATHTTDIPSMKASFLIKALGYKANCEVRLYNFAEL